MWKRKGSNTGERWPQVIMSGWGRGQPQPHTADPESHRVAGTPYCAPWVRVHARACAVQVCVWSHELSLEAELAVCAQVSPVPLWTSCHWSGGRDGFKGSCDFGICHSHRNRRQQPHALYLAESATLNSVFPPSLEWPVIPDIASDPQEGCGPTWGRHQGVFQHQCKSPAMKTKLAWRTFVCKLGKAEDGRKSRTVLWSIYLISRSSKVSSLFLIPHCLGLNPRASTS